MTDRDTLKKFGEYLRILAAPPGTGGTWLLMGMTADLVSRLADGMAADQTLDSMIDDAHELKASGALNAALADPKT